jgi:hypothetical protein
MEISPKIMWLEQWALPPNYSDKLLLLLLLLLLFGGGASTKGNVCVKT